jgi:hypothetical protein
MIVQKLRAARTRKKARTGKCEGRPFYGTKPGEAETLEKIMELRGDGYSVHAIAKTLNGEGVVTRLGKAWIGATVAKIIRREEAA